MYIYLVHIVCTYSILKFHSEEKAPVTLKNCITPLHESYLEYYVLLTSLIEHFLFFIHIFRHLLLGATVIYAKLEQL